MNDAYFAHVKAEKKSKKEGDIFEAKKEVYAPSEQRKKDQVEVDKQVHKYVLYFSQGYILYISIIYSLTRREGRSPAKKNFFKVF